MRHPVQKCSRLRCLLITCQRFDDLFLFGMVWQYSTNLNQYGKVQSYGYLLTAHYHLQVQANPKKLYKKGMLFLASMRETGLFELRCQTFRNDCRYFKVAASKFTGRLSFNLNNLRRPK